MKVKNAVLAALAITLMAGVALADHHAPIGVWEGESDQGGAFTVTISASGDGYSGTLDGDLGLLELADIEFANGTLSFTIDIDFGGQEATIAVSGTIDGNTFEGNVEIPDLGEQPITMAKAVATDFSAVVGTWSGDTDQGPITVVITDTGGALGGTLESSLGVNDISDVTFADGEVSFVVNLDFGGQEIALEFKGAIDGDTFDGQIEVPDYAEFPLTMTREAAAASDNSAIVGTWEGETPQGAVTIIITETDGVLAGTADSSLGVATISDVALADGEVSFVIAADAGGQEVVFEFKGSIDGDSIDGSFEVPDFGEFPLALTRVVGGGGGGDWAAALGTWEGMTDNGPVSLTITESGGALSGTIETGLGVSDLSDVAFADGTLSAVATLDLGGQEMVLEFSGTIDGDSYTANVEIEGFGEIAIPMTRAGEGDSASEEGGPAGEFEVTYEVQGTSRTATLKIVKGADGSFSGTWTDQRGSSDLANVAADGNSLTFGRTLDFGGQSFDLEYSATVDGDSIKGTIVAGDFGDIPFEGTRLGGGGNELAALLGTWNLAFDAGGNSIEITLTIAEEDGNLTGIWGSAQGGDTEISDVAFEDGAVSFKVTVETPMGEINLTFSGTIDGNEVTGEIDSDFGAFPVTGTKAD